MKARSEQMETCLFIAGAVCTVSRRKQCSVSSESHKSISGILFILQSSTMFT